MLEKSLSPSAAYEFSEIRAPRVVSKRLFSVELEEVESEERQVKREAA